MVIWKVYIESIGCLINCIVKALISQREGNFQLYVETLEEMLPWLFITDHYHYARWLSVHVLDMKQLEANAPSVFQEFLGGNFVTQKSSRKCSQMAHDQVHKQLNAMVKGDGRVIGLTENEPAMKKWMVAGPELARMIEEYEEKHNEKGANDTRHHKQTPSIQDEFMKDVQNTVDNIKERGSPFLEENKDVYSLDTKIMMSDDSGKAMMGAEEKGWQQFHTFVDGRLCDKTDTFYENIQKNHLNMFDSPRKRSSNQKNKAQSLKHDVDIFSRMYVSCQVRGGDMDTFFKHENQPWPPSLAEQDNMRLPNSKADLLEPLEAMAASINESPRAYIKIVDGAALVHSLNPAKTDTEKHVKTISDYAEHVFAPHIKKQLSTVNRVDIVWDRYLKDSLKNAARQSWTHWIGRVF